MSKRCLFLSVALWISMEIPCQAQFPGSVLSSIIAFFNVSYQNLTTGNYQIVKVNQSAFTLSLKRIVDNPEFGQSFVSNSSNIGSVLEQSLESDVKVASCPQGSFAGMGASVCTLCAAGTFSLVRNAASVDVCQPCGIGTYSAVVGASSSNVCVGCPVNTWSDRVGLSGSELCTKCPVHSISQNTSTKQTDCQCVSGFGGSITEFGLQCVECMGGYYKNHVSNSACAVCEAGSWSGARSLNCSSCLNNTFSGIGDSQCTPCPMYSRSGIGAKREMCTCMSGYFKTAQGLCNVCPKGTYGVDGVTCPFCPSGMYQDMAGSSECVACPLRWYCPGNGLNRIECPLGMFTLNTSSTEVGQCLNCPENYFCPSTVWTYACPGNTISPVKSRSLLNCTCVGGKTCEFKQVSQSSIKLNMTLAFFNNKTIQEKIAYAVANASSIMKEQVFLVGVVEVT